MGPDDVRERILSGRVWDDFCERLKAAGALVRADGNPTDLMTQALGYRFLVDMPWWAHMETMTPNQILDLPIFSI